MSQIDDAGKQLQSSDDDARITLGVLHAVEANSAVTQRSVASDLGIALGLTNAYLKRCVRKGLIKVTQVPANRYAYYLTPKGFGEKSRLTAQYLSTSFNFFRSARVQCKAVFDECEARGWRRIALAGAGDLSEIAALCAQDHSVEVVGVVDDQSNQPRCAGLPVARRLKDLGTVSAVIVCDMQDPQAIFDALVDLMPRERVLAPALLHISRNPPRFGE